jgi:oxygen-dependent protoporphyrinogen oxidase
VLRCDNLVDVSDAIIIGGGISGLASAYYLSKKGISSTLIEAQSRVGGLIRTDVVAGCQIEAGPDSYVASKPAATELAQEIAELKNEIIGTNDEARRIYLVNDGKLVAMPSGMVLMAPSDMRAFLSSPLFSEETKCRMLQERFFKPRERSNDISVAELVNEHFDSNILNAITEPLLTGVYGGDAGKLSAQSVLPGFMEYERSYGSLVRAVRAQRKQKQETSLFLSFKRGMQQLTDAVQRASSGAVTSVTGEATQIEKTRDGWRVHVGRSKQEAKFLIVAVPAHRAACLFAESHPDLSGELGAIPYSSAITVVLGYAEKDVPHPLDGFGFLVPQTERRGVAACTWINTKFPQRVAPGLVVLRAFIVDRDAEALMAEPEHEIFRVVRNEILRLMGSDAEPAFSLLHRWSRSMPQYVVGHAARYKRIATAIAQEPGLHLVGNAYEGVGIPDCVRLAKRAAAAIEF